MQEKISTALLSPESKNQTSHVYEAIAALELSSNPIERARQIAQNTTSEGILSAITGLHRALAPDVPHVASDVARTLQDPRTGEVTSVLMDPDKRVPFFEQASVVIRALGEQINPGEEQAFLNRAGNVLALSVVLAHNFEDGNGRTARTLAHAMRYGSEVTPSSQEEFDLVSTNRPEHGFKINSYCPVKQGKDMSQDQLVVAAAAFDIPLSDQAGYQKHVDAHFAIPYTQA